jgi:putative ABC transport system ATP-binding protein
LLLDEPTGDLDSVNSAIIMDLLIQLNRNDGITLVMVTHDVSIKFFADRVIWLRDGKIQRVEIVSDEKKQESVDNLTTKLNEIQRKKELAQERKVRTEQHQKKRDVKQKAFIIRRPTDYKTHPEYVPGSVALTDFTTVFDE